MRIVPVLTASLVVTAVSLSAALAQESQLPPLISSTFVTPDDSALVRAAKQAVRSRTGTGRRVVVDASLAGRGRMSQASGSPEFSFYLPPSLPSPTADSGEESGSEQAARETRERIEALRREQVRMAAEADEGAYGFDTEEDQVEQRLTNIANELDRLSQPEPAAPPH